MKVINDWFVYEVAIASSDQKNPQKRNISFQSETRTFRKAQTPIYFANRNGCKKIFSPWAKQIIFPGPIYSIPFSLSPLFPLAKFGARIRPRSRIAIRLMVFGFRSESSTRQRSSKVCDYKPRSDFYIDELYCLYDAHLKKTINNVLDVNK